MRQIASIHALGDELPAVNLRSDFQVFLVVRPCTGSEPTGRRSPAAALSHDLCAHHPRCCQYAKSRLRLPEKTRLTVWIARYHRRPPMVLMLPYSAQPDIYSGKAVSSSIFSLVRCSVPGRKSESEGLQLRTGFPLCLLAPVVSRARHLPHRRSFCAA